ncbi:Marine sediment metagenome DNA, contig: S03H2_C02747 OS=marine sediment metagenome GN=S03H2_06319 PE=4 SV=1: PAC2 [Gemmata massiliana]|uniref:PAC2 family protein n=1 Tax=Gemmata massiliana TaxID=1210884 RepID=A0A6P2D609_9BACT|nr:PAC2 family protein [Gemmata massiliana]VTR94860.1 Marine sediment metagenome DNA, contig: S03H2_C02747 OS=marine sediment metagenome GN=S03H2_06319 PE=4 SV=1: PAC2 [Gemmata massiliana]
MPEIPKLTHPWFVAVWPGMGHVALNAGVYLLAKLGMTAVAEFEAGELFDVAQVEVKDGIIQPARRPRNRFFVWIDPNKRHDLVVFLGEAQPPVGKFPFCRQVIDYARELGVERVITFAAMATEMRPEHPSRVFGAATDTDGVAELRRLDVTILEEGHIGGLNGVLLGAAAASGLRGSCFLGEMPQVFAQVPFPKASLAILEAFAVMTGIELDLDELAEQAHAVEEQLGELLARVEDQYESPNEEAEEGAGDDEGEEFSSDEEESESESSSVQHEGIGYQYDGPDEPVSQTAVQRIEELFARAATDRTKAFELKRELDRLGLFKRYEDRFLDLFKHSD